MLVQVVKSSKRTVETLFKYLPSPLLVQVPLARKQQLAACRATIRPFATSNPRFRRYLISEGRTTTKSEQKDGESSSSSTPQLLSPFYLETGYSIFAKRPSRPFPPPFVYLPSGSFSDPLTTHNPSSVPRSARRPMVDGEPMRGITNGDDAIIIGRAQTFIAVNDGVGAWAERDRGNAALWSRLIAHFWDVEVEKSLDNGVDPVRDLETAYDATKKATKGSLKKDREDEVYSESEESESSDKSSPGNSPPRSSNESSEAKDSSKTEILGTTTASSALLHHQGSSSDIRPIVLATTLGDCKVLIIRPTPSSSSPSDKPPKPKEDDESDSETSGGTILYRSKEQWHWFDCPRQLGTNSPDTPTGDAVCDTVEDIQIGDVVAVLSDGVTDNLWEHEICQSICESISHWQSAASESDDGGKSRHNAEDGDAKDGVVYVARRLMNAAREIAMDPNAESPYMERAFDEGIAAEGGKLDDISVVVGIVRKRE